MRRPAKRSRRILGEARDRMEEDPQSLRLAVWDGDRFDFNPEPAVTITIRGPRVLRRLAVGDMSSLGDASVAVTLTVEGAVRDALHAGLGIADGSAARGSSSAWHRWWP